MTTRIRPPLTAVALAAAVVAAGLLTAGCEINSPEMPSFDTAFTLPLGTETLTIMEAVDDEDFLIVGDDGSLGFQVDGDPDTLQLDFDLSVDLPTESVDQGLGNFALPAGAPLGYDFTLADLWPPAGGASGLTTIVPAFPFDLTSAGQDLPDIESATLAEGQLSVTITNGFAVPVGASGGPDQIVLSLVNPADDSLLAQLVFPRVDPGQTVTRPANLAGVTLPDAIAVRLSGGSPGSGLQLVTVSGSDAIAVQAAFSDLVVSSATAVIDQQTFTSSFSSALPADYEISRAVIASGAIGLDLTNGLPLPCTVYVSWDQVRDVAGTPLIRQYDLAVGTALAASIDLAGYVVQADDVPLTSLDATINIVTPGSGGAPVTLSASDGLTAGLGGGTLAFSSVTGVVPAYTVALEPLTESIDLPGEMDGLELTAASLVLTLTNSAGIAADMNLVLTGTAANGTVRSLAVSEQVLPAIGRATAVTTIVMDESNSGILDFLNNLPETITLAGDVVAGGGAAGTVHADDFAVVGWEIAAPVEVIITGATIDSDPEALDLDADLAERIATHARGAVLQAEILNHLPLGVQLRVVADTDTNRLAIDPMLVIGPIDVAAGLLDATTHAVSSPVTSRPTLTLTEQEARIFGLPGLHTRIEAYLPATNGQPVRVMSTDYLEFRGVVQLEVLIDDEL